MRPNPHPETGDPVRPLPPHPAGTRNQETAMALTDPPSGQHTGPGYDDTPAGNIWRQAAGPTTTRTARPDRPRLPPAQAADTGRMNGRPRLFDRLVDAVRRARRQQPRPH